MTKGTVGRLRPVDVIEQEVPASLATATLPRAAALRLARASMVATLVAFSSTAAPVFGRGAAPSAPGASHAHPAQIVATASGPALDNAMRELWTRHMEWT